MADLATALREFTGRLHVVLVHFPIALIAVAALLEFLRRRTSAVSSQARVVLGLGVLGAGAAAFSGWTLADVEPVGRAAEETLFLHRWSGVASLALAAVAWLLAWAVPLEGRASRLSGLYRLSLLLALLASSGAGHFGGELVHGEGYLFAPFMDEEEAPPSRSPGAGDAGAGDSGASDSNAQSGAVLGAQAADDPAAAAPDPPRVDYATQIQPIFAQTCYSCHGPRRVKGKLRLDGAEHVFDPARRDDWVIVPGDAAGSELLRRIALPADDLDIMPAQGDPLRPEEIALIARWIDEGAAWDDAAVAAPPSGAASGAPSAPGAGAAAASGAAASDGLPPGLVPPPTFSGPPLAQDLVAQQILAALAERGALVEPLGEGSEYLSISLAHLDPRADDGDLALLMGLGPRVVALDLSRSAVTDAGLAQLASFFVLQRLRLDRTTIGDGGLVHLSALPALSWLNLVGTRLTDAAAGTLAAMAPLRQVYLWGTLLSQDGVSALRAARPDLHVDAGDPSGG